jgi:hypothetical protein
MTHRPLALGPLLAGLALLCACSANVVLRRRPATDTGALGPFQRCEAVEKPCAGDPTYDSSRFNAANTTFLSLPECPFGIQEILVQDAGSADAVAIVRCAAPPIAAPAPSTGLPTTAPGGGTTSTPTPQTN